MQKKVRLVLLGIILFNSLWSQNKDFDFRPARNYTLTKNNPALMGAVKFSFDSLIKIHKDKDKKVKKMIEEAYTDLLDNIVFLDTSSSSMYSDSLTLYFQKILNRVKDANPDIKGRRFTLLLSRTDVPNASNYSAGVILVNLDLIAKMHSEDEMAFIICHEMSHDILNHVQKGIVKRAEILYSKEVKDQISQIKKQEFKVNKAINDLIKKITANYTFHSRDNELQADSLGMLLFSKANYNINEGINAIAFLDSIDRPFYRDSISVRKYLEFSDLKLSDEYFVRNGDVDLGEGNLKDYKLADSLKTHPNCPLRVEKLKQLVIKANLTNESKFGEKDRYEKYALQTRFEMIEMWFNVGDYGLCSFNCMQMLERYPNNAYLKCMLVNSLAGIYHAQVKHKFFYCVDLPDKSNEKAYNDYLIFLHNTNSSITKQMVLKYYNKHVANLKDDELKVFTEIMKSSVETASKDLKSIPSNYRKNNGKEYYFRKLNSIFIEN